jgi:predicted transcriptional regulator
MTKKLLNFKECPVQELSLDELKETIDERNIGGNPISGIVHHVLFQRVYDMLEKAKLLFDMDPIYATSGGASAFPGVTLLPVLEEKHGIGALEAHLLRRMITAFNIRKGETDETTQSIAIAYHQQGIQVAFGPNIKICKNQCIYGSSNRHQTFGDNKVNVETLFQVISDWIFNYDEIRQRDLAILEGMKTIVLNYSNVCDIIGELNLKRVAKDSLRIAPEYILQQNQIGDVSTSYLKFLKGDNANLDYQKGLTLYEFYNMCTELYKPEHTDLPNIIGRNHMLGDYLIEKFELADLN